MVYRRTLPLNKKLSVFKSDKYGNFIKLESVTFRNLKLKYPKAIRLQGARRR